MIATLPEKLKKRLAAVDTRVHVVSVKCPCNERQIREQRSHIHPKGDCPVRPSGLLKVSFRLGFERQASRSSHIVVC